MRLLLAAVLCLTACASVPVTGRRQMLLISQDEERRMGEQAYAQVLAKERLSSDAAVQERVRRIGLDLARAAQRPDFKWEFTVIDEPKTVNAFCLPGGKVAVYTGLLPVAESDDGLAVVMGHEIAHALARHGAERMSQGRLASIGGAVVTVLTGAQDPVTREAVHQAYGVGMSAGVLLPFSRKHESEADKIGLLLMAKAGYDPRAALEFWKRMEKSKGGGGAPLEKFLSTHPTDQQRQENIRKWLPDALKHYKSGA